MFKLKIKIQIKILNFYCKKFLLINYKRNEFKNINLDKNDNPIDELLSDHSSLTVKFQEYEEHILKSMENKQDIEKELEKIKMENEIELVKLLDQEEISKKELNKVKVLSEKDNKIIKDLKRNFSDNGTNSEVSKMVSELYQAAILNDQNNLFNKKNKNKKDFEHIEEIVKKLKVSF